MKVNISKNEALLSVSACKMDFEKAENLLRFLGVDSVTVFIDEGNWYSFQNTFQISDLKKYISEADNSLLIFDDYIAECLMDKELDILMNKKIMIDYNLGENMTHILINLKKVEITKEKAEVILK